MSDGTRTRSTGRPGCDYCGNGGARSQPYKDGDTTVYAHPACRVNARNSLNTTNSLPVTTPQVGDLASHRSGELDSRVVSNVVGSNIWLWLGNAPAGPFQSRNYTFQRKAENEGTD